MGMNVSLADLASAVFSDPDHGTEAARITRYPNSTGLASTNSSSFGVWNRFVWSVVVDCH
jgi:hypothetical protein